MRWLGFGLEPMQNTIDYYEAEKKNHERIRKYKVGWAMPTTS